ncbi:MAG: hypothetical protein Q9228_004785 [Teloschistes exilis]
MTTGGSGLESSRSVNSPNSLTTQHGVFQHIEDEIEEDAMDIAPIVVSPSQGWDGNDGPWSTFALGFGNPPQFVRVLISTTCPQPWAVDPLGCTPTDPPNCISNRGNRFNKNASSTWQDKGLYELDQELNLGYTGNGNFGLDSLTLGYPGSGAITLDHQVVATIAAKDFYLATWGIAPRPTNLTSDSNAVIFAANNSHQSVLSTLRHDNQIPSLSYGYTAGARYRLNQVSASLTLGGYDASHFHPSNITHNFADDNSRDLVVGIQSISILDSAVILLPNPILSFVDATVSHIWLPLQACQAFETAFGIEHDAQSDLYLVNETTHQALVTRNATLVFTIGSDRTSTDVANITLPYASFDLQVTTAYPNVKNATRYFPLRRAANDTQYTLGRTFLQEAYLIADYERSQFSINQCRFVEEPTDVRAILPPNTTNRTDNPISTSRQSTGGLSRGVIAAIVVVSTLFLLLLSTALFLLWRKKRRVLQSGGSERKQSDHSPSAELSDLQNLDALERELHGEAMPPPELHGIPIGPLEMDGGVAVAEMSSMDGKAER